MKKLITTLAVCIIIASQTLFAHSHEALAPGAVKNSFEIKFGNSTNVNWEKIQDVFVGRFTDNGERFEAYYWENGELLGTGRYIPESYLPRFISKSIQTRFEGYTITSLFEFNPENAGTSYFLRLENETMELQARAYNDGKTEIIKKTKK